MKYFKIVIILTYVINANGQAKNWELIWSDEFNGVSLDSTYWSKQNKGRANWSNTAIADHRVIEVSDGTLKLKGIKNPNSNVDLSTVANIDTSTVWTGAIRSQNKVGFKYGKIEIRAKLDRAPRAWPAIWLMPTRSLYGGNPDSGEIDIVEHLNLDPYYYSTIHTQYNTVHRDDPERYTIEKTNEGVWNVHAVEWYEDKIVFLRNGTKYHTFNKGDHVKIDNLLRWPFDQEFYVILSQQIGGSWVDGEARSKGLVLEDSDLPITLEIDYVRIYKEK